MKRFIVLSVLCFISFGVFAQHSTERTFRKNTIKVSPIEFGRSEFQFAYERNLNNRKSSLSIMPSIFLKETNSESFEGIQIQSQYRFYLNHIGSDEKRNFMGVYNYGLYAALYGQYLNYDRSYTRYDSYLGTERDFEQTINAFEGGALMGIQVDITERIVMDFFLGGGIRKSNTNDTGEGSDYYYSGERVFDLDYTGVKPKIGLMFGVTI